MGIRVFAGSDVDAPAVRQFILDHGEELTASISRLMANEGRSIEAIKAADVPGKVASLISFSTDPSKMRRWERLADVKVIEPDLPNRPGSVELSFTRLLRDLGFCIATPALYGQDFLDRNQDLLEDFWKFDNGAFPLLTIGVPQWVPIPAMREGIAARQRLVVAMGQLYRRADQHQRGEPVDFDADVSDLSSIVWTRLAVYQRQKVPESRIGGLDLSILWALNANLQQLIFWVMINIYSSPELLDELRKEVAPFVPVDDGQHPQNITSLDMAGLSRDCLLMKSTLFEAYRVALDPTAIRYVERSVTVDDGSRKHNIKSGSWLSVPFGFTHSDPAYFPDPGTFTADRFLTEAQGTGKRSVRYGSALKPWGWGPAMCKGRIFAEKELLAIAASMITLWDVTPTDGTWKIPAMLPGTGSRLPVSDVRVIFQRRRARG